MLAFTSGAMPLPVSDTWIPAYWPDPGSVQSAQSLSRRVQLAVSSVIRPGPWMASRALTTRFVSTCSSWVGSAHAGLPGKLDALPRQPLQDRQELGHRLVEIHRLRIQRLAPGEPQHAGCELRRVAGSLDDLLEVLPLGPTLLHLVERQIRVRKDHAQHVVVIVGHPAGKPTDGFQLLRLVELGLELRPLAGVAVLLGDVTPDAQHPDEG